MAPGLIPSVSADEPQVRTSSADVDLGTATPGHLRGTVGLSSATLGLSDHVLLGTYVAPWLIAAFFDDSIAPNAFARVEFLRTKGFSASLSSSLFYARLGDVDSDGLKARALIWPLRAHAAYRWHHRHATTLELGTVYSSITGDSPGQNDTRVHGVAIARSSHLGIIQRMRLTKRLSIWGRMRFLLGHSPVKADAQSDLSESLRVHVEARANASELSSGVAGVAGVHLEWKRFALTAGAGYGTWFLPAIYLPVGQNAPIGELKFYFRF